jgi:predicted protein tyrosine phosphatase
MGSNYVELDWHLTLRELVEMMYYEYDTFEELINFLSNDLKKQCNITLTEEDVEWCKCVYSMTDMHHELGID